MGFIGQKLLLNKLNNLNLDSMPRSLLLLGDVGCGKHTYSNLIANRLGLKLVDIIARDLPVPHRELCPVTLEEQLICYADKFFSKTRLDSEDSLERVMQKMAKWGDESIEQLRHWANLFE
jgi:Holliday junction resolvasome RuvABC ATP-dependent DNA helicase subunit